MVKFKIVTVVNSQVGSYWFFKMYVGKTEFVVMQNYNRESDARRGAKRVAKNLGIVYEEIK